MSRYSEKDIEDISKLIKCSDKDLVLKLINTVIERTDISHRVKEVFIRNVNLFRGDFSV